MSLNMLSRCKDRFVSSLVGQPKSFLRTTRNDKLSQNIPSMSGTMLTQSLTAAHHTRQIYLNYQPKCYNNCSEQRFSHVDQMASPNTCLHSKTNQVATWNTSLQNRRKVRAVHPHMVRGEKMYAVIDFLKREVTEQHGKFL